VKRALLAAALGAAAACHSGTRPAPPAAATARDGGTPASPADAGARPDPAQAAWEQRDSDPAALDRAISLWEEQALANPQPAAPLLGAARGRRLRIARAEQRPDLDAAAVAADAQACAADARRSWAAEYPAAAAATDVAEAGALIGAQGAEALYLESVCTAEWARMQGFTPLIERRGQLMASFARVAQLAPDLDGAGPDREIGALYAGLPAYAGGDLDKARKHLDAAIARAPQDARNRIVLARAVAVKAQDRALFEEQLRTAGASPDAALAAQAQSLLSRVNDLFGPPEAGQEVPKAPQR
jgi:hypothetical protein